MTQLITTSVARGSVRGDSHGGAYLIDLAEQTGVQVLDWNSVDIDWRGRGGDRGLRGIAFYRQTVFIAASTELLAFDPSMQLTGRWSNPYLKHCQEISVHQDQVFIVSAGYDSILAFDIIKQEFHWALHIENDGYRVGGDHFDPRGEEGPLQLNKLGLNSVTANDDGMYIAGLKSGGMLHFNGKTINMSAELPDGTHNARPFADGVLFNDTEAGVVRFAGRDQRDRAFNVPAHGDSSFGRGLCVVNERIVAAGATPSTIAVHDLESGETALTVALSDDVNSSIHGIAIWPFS
jgi:hypothetical protein